MPLQYKQYNQRKILEKENKIQAHIKLEYIQTSSVNQVKIFKLISKRECFLPLQQYNNNMFGTCIRNSSNEGQKFANSQRVNSKICYRNRYGNEFVKLYHCQYSSRQKIACGTVKSQTSIVNTSTQNYKSSKLLSSKAFKSSPKQHRCLISSVVEKCPGFQACYESILALDSI